MNADVRIVASSPWKRKRPEDADVYYNRIPRRGPFHEMISGGSGAKDAPEDPTKRTQSRPCAEPHAARTTTTTTTLSPIERLPYETFLHIASYLGPTASLPAMARVNRRYDRFLSRIGDVMLHKARRCFRNPPPLLPLASPNTTSGTIISPRTLRKESSISVFVRYSSHCSRIHDRLEILRRLLLLGDGDKDACGTRQDYDDDERRPTKRFRKTTATAAAIGHDSSVRVATTLCSTTQPSISSHNVDEALAVATDLVTALSNSLSLPGRHLACSYALEARILAMAGKVGGVVYKHSKGTLERLEHEVFLGNGAGDGGDDDGIAHCEEDNDGRGPDDGVSREIQKQISLDVERIDRARVLMQRVMFHKLLLENK